MQLIIAHKVPSLALCLILFSSVATAQSDIDWTIKIERSLKRNAPKWSASRENIKQGDVLFELKHNRKEVVLRVKEHPYAEKAKKEFQLFKILYTMPPAKTLKLHMLNQWDDVEMFGGHDKDGFAVIVRKGNIVFISSASSLTVAKRFAKYVIDGLAAT